MFQVVIYRESFPGCLSRQVVFTGDQEAATQALRAYPGSMLIGG